MSYIFAPQDIINVMPVLSMKVQARKPSLNRQRKADKHSTKAKMPLLYDAEKKTQDNYDNSLKNH